uniref:Dynamin GTPase n=1 Tax=Rhabditophanes sp. KR3021 TaxID=114890 RepID=A0AC35UDA4_9BILA
MDYLIPIINKLQSVFNVTGNSGIIDLPQIVVVGSQSSGKSSVLEGIVGRDFLPRGSGIVTRRPLILHLINVKENQKEANEWAVFDHAPNKEFTDFDLVRQEIQRVTDEVTGNNKSISDLPIGLKIYSNKVVNLSLIDLPGITKIAVGDQPENIEEQITKMIMKYVSNPNAIILAVTPANQDFATSEAIKLARSVDREGLRTIAVLTKLDLMDSGTDAIAVLTGNVVPVKLGIVGVVNRSQKHINENKTIGDALKDEAIFIQQNYPTLMSRNGTSYLAKCLNKILLTHIKKILPSLKEKVVRIHAQLKREISIIGEPSTDKAKTLLAVLSKFTTSYNAAIDGTSTNIETQHLIGGARISFIFNNILPKALNEIDPGVTYSQRDISNAIRNASGTKTSLFVSTQCFELLVKQQIRRLEDPCLYCADLVYEEMVKLLQHCGDDFQKEMDRFPKLSDSIHSLLKDLLKAKLDPAKVYIQDLINIQACYINTANVDFSRSIKNYLESTDVMPKEKKSKTKNNSKLDNLVGETERVSLENGTAKDNEDQNAAENRSSWFFGNNQPVAKPTTTLKNTAETTKIQPKNGVQVSHDSDAIHGAKAQSLTPTKQNSLEMSNSHTNSSDKKDCELIMKVTKQYFEGVRKSILDTVPKAIMYFLVNEVRSNLHNELLRKLYDQSKFDDLLTENESIEQRRRHCVATLISLDKAVKILSEVNETVLL